MPGGVAQHCGGIGDISREPARVLDQGIGRSVTALFWRGYPASSLEEPIAQDDRRRRDAGYGPAENIGIERSARTAVTPDGVQDRDLLADLHAVGRQRLVRVLAGLLTAGALALAAFRGIDRAQVRVR